MTLRAGFAKLVGVALAGSLLAVAAPAAAKPCHHHGGGNSEVSAYVENIPGPCGNQDVGGGNGSGHHAGGGGPTSNSGGGPGSALPSSSVQGLQNLGPVGAATARFAESTAPGFAGRGGAGARAGSNGANGTGGGGSAADTPQAIDTGDGSVTGALANLVTGGSDQGMGPLLPILLGAILLGGLGFVALRRGYTQ
jgi:hypothetical protein